MGSVSKLVYQKFCIYLPVFLVAVFVRYKLLSWLFSKATRVFNGYLFGIVCIQGHKVTVGNLKLKHSRLEIWSSGNAQYIQFSLIRVGTVLWHPNPALEYHPFRKQQNRNVVQ